MHKWPRGSIAPPLSPTPKGLLMLQRLWNSIDASCQPHQITEKQGLRQGDHSSTVASSALGAAEPIKGASIFAPAQAAESKGSGTG